MNNNVIIFPVTGMHCANCAMNIEKNVRGMPGIKNVAVNFAAELGILFKNSQALETLNQVSVIVLDKTGTLTKGKPTVVDAFVTDPGLNGPQELLTIAASVEKGSEHPVGKAVVAEASLRGIEAPADRRNFRVTAG